MFPQAALTAGNILAFLTALIAAGLYGNIGIKVRMRGYRYHEPIPTRWRFDLLVRLRLCLSYCRMLLPVTESSKGFESQTGLFGRWLDTG
jgi:hypothetical protein